MAYFANFMVASTTRQMKGRGKNTAMQELRFSGTWWHEEWVMCCCIVNSRQREHASIPVRCFDGATVSQRWHLGVWTFWPLHESFPDTARVRLGLHVIVPLPHLDFKRYM